VLPSGLNLFQFQSLIFRLIAISAVWTVIALVAGGFALTSVFRESVERTFDDKLEVFLDTIVAGSEVLPNGKLTLIATLAEPRFERTFSGWYWQIEGARGVGAPPGPDLSSRSLFDFVLELPTGISRSAATTSYINGPDGQRLRAIAREIALPGSGLPFIFLVAGDASEIDNETARFETMIMWSFVALALGLVGSLMLFVRLGLAPLRLVSQALANIRSGRAERLDGSFPSEIQPLADELNELVDHNAALLERARTHVGNLAHALKTPLTVLTNESSKQSGRFADTVDKQVGAMRSQIDHHLARARTAANARVLGSRTDVLQTFERLVRTVERIYFDRHLDFDVDCEAGVAFRGEEEDFEEMVGNLLDNACKWADTQILVKAVVDETALKNRLCITVEDDGPGLPDHALKDVLKRGTRLDESVPGSGLGLSIVRDIAELYGGAITLTRSEDGGLRAQLVLPAADRAVEKKN